FMDLPRYSTGYAAVHNTIGFMPETHMLKPFHLRVKGTRAFMEQVIAVVERDAKLIGENRVKADEAVRNQKTFVLDWKLDRETSGTFNFKGFEAKRKPSEISGLDRLYYDRHAPFQKEIKVWDNFVAGTTIEKPIAYVIPQA